MHIWGRCGSDRSVRPPRTSNKPPHLPPPQDTSRRLETCMCRIQERFFWPALGDLLRNEQKNLEGGSACLPLMNICHVGGGDSNHKPFKSGTYRFSSLLHVLNRCRVCNLEQFHPFQAGFHTPNVKLVRDAHFAAGALADGASTCSSQTSPGPFCPSFIGPGLRHVAVLTGHLSLH